MRSTTRKNINPILKKLFIKKGIQTCELKLPGCENNWALGFAHRHKRNWYLGSPELLTDFNQVVLACITCHEQIEYDADLTETMFRRLRGSEEIN